jgi:hypothetical protein
MRLNKNNIYYGGLHRKLREPNKTSIDSFNEFINIVGINHELNNAKLLIGISYSYSRNLNREIEDLQPDFCWSEDSSNREFSNSENSPKNQWYQLFFPFSISPIYQTNDFFIPLVAKDFDEESNKIEQVFEYFKESGILNKFSLIVFDSSTSKFLFPSIINFITFPSFISYLFYYFLEVGGELYIDLHFICSSLSIFEVNNINTFEKLKIIIENRNHVNNMKETDEIFGQKFIYIIYTNKIISGPKLLTELIIKGNKYQIPEINIEIIRKNNIEYLKRNLLCSKIEYFPNESETKEVKENRTTYIQPEYPIKKTNYPIKGFIKITKTNNLNKDNIEDFKIIFSVIYNDLIVHKINPEIPQKDLDGLNCLFI